MNWLEVNERSEEYRLFYASDPAPTMELEGIRNAIMFDTKAKSTRTTLLKLLNVIVII